MSIQSWDWERHTVYLQRHTGHRHWHRHRQYWVWVGHWALAPCPWQLAALLAFPWPVYVYVVICTIHNTSCTQAQQHTTKSKRHSTPHAACHIMSHDGTCQMSGRRAARQRQRPQGALCLGPECLCPIACCTDLDSDHSNRTRSP
jgi:hypothetical protein